jgi:hypothetical protein
MSRKFALCIVSEVSANPKYFCYASGSLDGEYACDYGEKVIGQPSGSAIYFAIDFDASKKSIKNNVIPYFKGVIDKISAAGSPYRIGVYGSGRTCQTLLDLKMVDFTWLAQSPRWADYSRFKSSRKWTLLQGPTTQACEIEVDCDEASIPDFGAFDSLNKVDSQLVIDAGRWSNVMISSALDGVDEGLKAKVLLLVQTCAEKGIKMVPFFGLRSPEEQAQLWRQSRNSSEVAAGVKRLHDKGATWLADILEKTKAPRGKHVTNALPGMSWHQWGEAMDCYREINGKPSWEDEYYEDYADLAEHKEIGLTPGGHWPGFPDWPHVQLRTAAGPQKLYSYPEIDAKMKEKWGLVSTKLL